MIITYYKDLSITQSNKEKIDDLIDNFITKEYCHKRPRKIYVQVTNKEWRER